MTSMNFLDYFFLFQIQKKTHAYVGHQQPEREREIGGQLFVLILFFKKILDFLFEIDWKKRENCTKSK